MSDNTLPPSGWYPDPAGGGGERYWDGESWSQVTRPGSGRTAAAGGADREPRYGSWLARVGAFLVDALLLMFPVALLQQVIMPDAWWERVNEWVEDVLSAVASGSTVVPDPDRTVMNAYLLLTAVQLVSWMVYRTVLVATTGASAGHHALSLTVQDSNGQRPGWGRAAVRGIAGPILMAVPLLNLANALIPAFHPRKQTLHDMLAGTVVVRKKLI